MSINRMAVRLLAGAGLGLTFVAACAGAAPAARTEEPRPEVASTELDAVEAARRDDSGKGNAAPDAGPRCPNGVLEDPHRGFIRCLNADERDAGWLPPAPQPEPPAVTEPPNANKPLPGPPPAVEMGAPKFENGEVARAEKALHGAAADIAKCVADNGGLSGATGSLKVQFLVRSRGRAEGVEVLSVKGVSAEAAACVRVLLKNKPIGPPTSDPVGVTVTISLKAAPSTPSK